ncbi:hypothetical protein E4U46_002175 [Claviceps purpurea]|nr:hypothetical protein E4U46_002175 [Claviceps purpurea]
MNETVAKGHVHASKLVKSRMYISNHDSRVQPSTPTHPMPRIPTISLQYPVYQATPGQSRLNTHQCSQPNAALRPRGPPEQQSLGAEQSASKAPGIREANN